MHTLGQWTDISCENDTIQFFGNLGGTHKYLSARHLFALLSVEDIVVDVPLPLCALVVFLGLRNEVGELEMVCREHLHDWLTAVCEIHVPASQIEFQK